MNHIAEISMYERSYIRWKKWMNFGARSGCHQRPDRSFSLRGYQFPVCARCAGVILGYLTALVLYLLGLKRNQAKRGKNTLPLIGCGIMLTDWGLQFIGKKESNNKRRLLTGIAGGFGVMTLQLSLITKLLHIIKKSHSAGSFAA